MYRLALLKELYEKSFELYQNSTEERKIRHSIEFENDDSSSVLDDLEIFSDTVIGIVLHFLDQRSTTKENLHTLEKVIDISATDYQKWFMETPGEFPKIKRYFEHIDYMRYIAIDCLNDDILSD